LLTPYQIWMYVVLGALLGMRWLPHGFHGAWIIRSCLLVALLPSGLSYVARLLVSWKLKSPAEGLYRIVVAIEKLFSVIPKNPYALGLPHHLADLAKLLIAQKRYPEAETVCKEALVAAEKQGASESLTVAVMVSLLGACLSEQGKYLESEKTTEKLIDVIEKLRPKIGQQVWGLHPSLGLANLCGNLAQQGRYTEAQAAGIRAVNLIEKEPVSTNPKAQLGLLAIALNNLGCAYDGAGQIADALGVYKRALDVKLKIHGPDHASVAMAQCNIGFAATCHGDLAEATRHLEEARRILIKLKLCDGNLWATVLNNIGDVQRLQGKLAEAETTLLESFKLSQRVLPPTNSHFSEGLLSLALLYRDKNDKAQADLYFKKTVENLENRKPVNKKKLGDALLEYANFLRSAGEITEAEDAEARAAEFARASAANVPANPAKI
jgi:tetratricopeptide (TPR) repeat protein